jgi:hypothetical protein
MAAPTLAGCSTGPVSTCSEPVAANVPSIMTKESTSRPAAPRRRPTLHARRLGQPGPPLLVLIAPTCPIPRPQKEDRRALVGDRLQRTCPRRSPNPSSATSWTPDSGLEISAGRGQATIASATVPRPGSRAERIGSRSRSSNVAHGQTTGRAESARASAFERRARHIARQGRRTFSFETPNDPPPLRRGTRPYFDLLARSMRLT